MIDNSTRVHLAKMVVMSPIRYERGRVSAAKEIGVRVSFLDKLVAQHRYMLRIQERVKALSGTLTAHGGDIYLDGVGWESLEKDRWLRSDIETHAQDLSQHLPRTPPGKPKLKLKVVD